MAIAHEDLRRSWNSFTGLGRPGILLGQCDAADALRTSPAFQILISGEPMLHWVPEGPGPARDGWDIAGVPGLVLRADAYASLEMRYRAGLLGALPMSDVFVQSVSLVVNPGTTSAASPILMTKEEVEQVPGQLPRVTMPTNFLIGS